MAIQRFDSQASYQHHPVSSLHLLLSIIQNRFNDRGVRLDADHKALSRALADDETEGSLFQYSLEKAIPLADSLAANLLFVNSFNEFHEDTQIEPVVCAVGGGNDCSTTRPETEPNDYTNGVEYHAYSHLYLDLLRDATSGVMVL